MYARAAPKARSGIRWEEGRSRNTGLRRRRAQEFAERKGGPATPGCAEGTLRNSLGGREVQEHRAAPKARSGIDWRNIGLATPSCGEVTLRNSFGGREVQQQDFLRSVSIKLFAMNPSPSVEEIVRDVL